MIGSKLDGPAHRPVGDDIAGCYAARSHGSQCRGCLKEDAVQAPGLTNVKLLDEKKMGGERFPPIFFGMSGRSDLEDRKHILVFVKGAVNGRHMLKFVNLAASVHIRTYGIFYIQPALPAGALLKDIKVWLISIPPHGPYALSAPFLALCSEYDKKLISHQ